MLLDGEELDPLLARARELGGRVVRAERVRRGVGPFARSRYEVTVDVPGLADDGGAGPGPAAGGAGDGRALGAAAADAARTAGVAGIAALLAAAESGDGVGAPGWAPVTGPAVAAPGIATPHAAGTPGSASTPATAPRNVAPGGPRPLPSGAAGTAAAGAGSVAPGTGTASAAAVGRALAAFPRTAPPAPTDRSRMAAPALLHDLGVPERLLPLGTADVTTALLGLAGRMPRPLAPALRPGKVVAVVGAPDEVLETCAQMLVREREHPFQLVLAGAEATMPGAGPRLTSPRRAARLREEGAGQALLVAVGAGTTAAERRLAANILAALDPDQVWAAVDARRAPGDLAEQLANLPETRVDALAGQWAGRATRPGSLLDLGLPVGWLDGLPATGVVWACVLDEARTRAAEPPAASHPPGAG